MTEKVKQARMSFFGFGPSIEIPSGEARFVKGPPAKAAFGVVGVNTLVTNEATCMLMGVYPRGSNELLIPLLLFLADDFAKASVLLARLVTPGNRILVEEGNELQLKVLNLGPELVHFSCVARCLVGELEDPCST